MELFDRSIKRSQQVEIFGRRTRRSLQMEIFDRRINLSLHLEMFHSRTERSLHMEIFDRTTNLSLHLEQFDRTTNLSLHLELFHSRTERSLHMEIFAHLLRLQASSRLHFGSPLDINIYQPIFSIDFYTVCTLFRSCGLGDLRRTIVTEKSRVFIQRVIELKNQKDKTTTPVIRFM